MKRILINISPLIVSAIIIALILIFCTPSKDEVKITFQVWDEEKNKYVDAFDEYVKVNSLTKDYMPAVQERKYYKWTETWTPPLEEIVTKSTTYKANYVPIKDTNKDNIADEEQVRIKFQVWDNKTKKYINVYNNLVTKGTSINDLVPKVPKRQYYTTTKNWSPKLEETAKTDKTYKAVYKPIKDVNKNNIADEEDKKYKVTFYKDPACMEIYKEVKDILVGQNVPKIESPTKQYYNFKGWDSNTNIEIKKDEKFCATWTPVNDINNNTIADEEEKGYKVTYYKDSACTQVYNEIKDVTLGSKVPTVENPTKQYYTFTGWSKSTDTIVKQDEKFCAKYKPINDINKNNIADEEDKKYKVIYYKDTKCTQVYKEFKDILQGTKAIMQG